MLKSQFLLVRSTIFRAQTDPKTTGFPHGRPWCSGRGRARGGENDDALAPPAVPGSGL